MGAGGRWVPWAACATLAAGLWFAPRFLPLIPGFVLAGLLLFVGYATVRLWFLAQRTTVSRPEWVLTGVIVLATIGFGMLAALGVGLVIAVFIFAVTYARLPVVRASSNLSVRRSAVDRGPAQDAVLDRRSAEVVTVSLQGFLFFGSVEALQTHVRGLLAGTPPARVVILDFRRVSGIDGTTLVGLRKLGFAARDHGSRIVLADLPPAVAEALDRQGLATGEDPRLMRADTTDAALEQAEAALLDGMPGAPGQGAARAALAALTGDETLARRLL